MVGLWEGVPASPVSGASDDTALRYSNSRRSSKRSRYSRRSERSNTPESSSVEFVGASDSKDEKDSKLVAKLNATAADERRKMLLNQLRIIDRRKAELKAIANSTGSTSAGSSGETVLPTIEAATPEPDEGDTLESNTRSNRRRKPNLSLDLPKSNSIRSRRVDIDRFCSSASPTAASVYGSPLPSPSSQMSGSPALSYADLPTRRSSRRATRPRTPSVLLNTMPGESVLRRQPIGVSKCKRFIFCKKILSLLSKNPSANPFSAPVKELWGPEAIPRYFDVITRPMDLGTIKKNLDGVIYLNTQESNPLRMFQPNLFAEDVRQVFRNAKIYNKRGDMLYNCATDLLEEFEQMWIELPDLPQPGETRRKRHAAVPPRSGSLAKRGRTSEAQLLFGDGTMAKGPSKSKSKKSPRSAPLHSSPRALKYTKFDETMNSRQLKRRQEYLRKCRIALRSRTSLPKGNTFYDRAALLYDVPLNDGEKNEVAKGIKRLPSAKLNTFLSIVGDAAAKDEEEVELDIMSLDTKTLRNIEAFLDTALPNFKTIRNSQIGVEFIAVEEFEAEEKQIIERLAQTPKSPRNSRKEEQVSNEAPAFEPAEKESEELYASSDSDSGDSDSESDGSDSDSD